MKWNGIIIIRAACVCRLCIIVIISCHVCLSISIVKPTRRTNVSNLFYFWNDTLRVSDGKTVRNM